MSSSPPFAVRSAYADRLRARVDARSEPRSSARRPPRCRMRADLHRLRQRQARHSPRAGQGASLICRGESFGFCPPVRPRALAAARPSIVRSRISAFSNFPDSTDDLKEQSPNRRRGIDPLVEYDQIHSPGLQELGDLNQMLERAPETVKLRDDELVAGALCDEQRLVQLWASGELAAGVVDEDPLASGSVEGVVLSFVVLIARRHALAADPHTPTVTRTGECWTLASYTSRVTPSVPETLASRTTRDRVPQTIVTGHRDSPWRSRVKPPAGARRLISSTA